MLCPSCDNPETDLIVSAKKGTISQTCRACGFHGPLEVNHKVNTFILKNPPNINPAAQGQSITEGKRKKGKGKNENGVSDGNPATGNNSGGDSDGDVTNNQAKETETQISSLIPAKTEDDDDTWTTDISEAAVRERMKDLTDGAKGMTISDDTEKSEKERMDLFYELVKQKIESGVIDDVATHKELVVEAERLDIMSKSTLVLAELLFSANITVEVKKHRKLLLRFTHNNLKAQRYLMGGIEQIIALHSVKLMDKVSGILKFFYDNDILEEKAILEWSQKVSKKYVSKEISTEIHDKAKPFIQWLQEAEEEESDEDDDDSELEIEYDDRARHSVITKEPIKPTTKQNVDDEGDEIDIDDI